MVTTRWIVAYKLILELSVAVVCKLVGQFAGAVDARHVQLLSGICVTTIDDFFGAAGWQFCEKCLFQVSFLG